ncbi:hypothetical protein L873DRAFT_1792400 [Choiromyces venosus 120613-1]|uniref:Pre-mRNA-splicing factor n=1 Tax=Choiromyces venosus 120613-1 TaxID=1336337 RepID=A0A3N4JAB2_9PEZI|nr:hypothetical protein L873DRAFT_1792400 [Choiromyces venosus 120613-1]
MSKPISISLAASKPLTAAASSSSTGTSRSNPFGKKRPAVGLDLDSDVDDDSSHREKVHVITAFDAARGGALGDGEGEGEGEEGPLVIAAMKNRDWRAEAERRRRGGKGSVWLPPEAFAGRNGGAGEGEEMEVDTGAGVQYGLQVFRKRAEDEQPPAVEEEEAAVPAEERTEEEQALAALLSNSSKAPATTLILPSAADTDWRDEQQAYKADVASRPDVPTLDDYAAVPVEEFGAALLRGMGWREGMEVGKRAGGGGEKQTKLRIVEKRPAFLGIGAKAKEEVPELGTWGKADKLGRKKGGKRVDTTYVPVVLIDKKTGRVVHETAAAPIGENGTKGMDKDRWDKKDQERTRDDSDRRRRDRSREHRGSSSSHHHHHHHHHHRDRERERYGDKHRDRERERERGEKLHRSRDERRGGGDERDSRRRSRDRYDRRDRDRR